MPAPPCPRSPSSPPPASASRPRPRGRGRAAGLRRHRLPSLGSAMGLCVSLAHVTTHIPFWTSIQPIYLSTPTETAGTAGHLHEVTGGRFRLGLGVSHEPRAPPPRACRPGQPAGRHAGLRGRRPRRRPATADARRSTSPRCGTGCSASPSRSPRGPIWANAARSAHARASSPGSRAPAEDGFFLANMIPTVIDDDRAAADAVNRRTMTGYVTLPNYRNYWKRGRLRGGDGRHRGRAGRRRARRACRRS